MMIINYRSIKSNRPLLLDVMSAEIVFLKNYRKYYAAMYIQISDGEIYLFVTQFI